MLHVKRFRKDLSKIREWVFFEEVLHLYDGRVSYSLQAIAVHKGNFQGGHYVSYVRDSAGFWNYVNDDARPLRVTFETVQQAEVYLMIFEMIASA